MDNLATLLVTGSANDSQLKALFNYLLIQHGHKPRFGRFMRKLAQQVPEHKERTMNIVEKIRRAGQRKGLREGMRQGRVEGRREEAQRIAHSMLADGLPRELIMRITGLSEEDIKSLTH